MRSLLWMLLLTAACQPSFPTVEGEPGTALPGLGETELVQFEAGLALFNKVFRPEEGLGPAFNENQCSACHTVPAAGGTTVNEFVTKATRYDPAAGCDLLVHAGGTNVRRQITPALRALGHGLEAVPDEATETGRFLPPFLFGIGLVDAIPDETILQREDPDDADGDGISGRAARTRDGRLARFGWKADVATLDEFTRSALYLEMGLTTAADEPDLVNGRPAPAGTDPLGEPEVDQRTIELLTAFSRFLAPTARVAPRSRAHADTLDAGARVFDEIGCSGCHTPTMRTGPHEIAALGNKTIHLYSDLLLHDMGPDLANVCAVDASPREFRTAPLMGLQHRQFFLHDGRAIDLRDAILAHGGEATAARNRFAGLPYMIQEYLILFLRSL
jgi:CxxC motif-containing protein (DUF1111 family)